MRRAPATAEQQQRRHDEQHEEEGFRYGDILVDYTPLDHLPLVAGADPAAIAANSRQLRDRMA